MSLVRVYTVANCVFCSRATSLLNRLGLEYELIPCADASDLPGDLRTFPQIYFGTKHIGGCMELYELQRNGHFDYLLTR